MFHYFDKFFRNSKKVTYSCTAHRSFPKDTESLFLYKSYLLFAKMVYVVSFSYDCCPVIINKNLLTIIMLVSFLLNQE